MNPIQKLFYDIHVTSINQILKKMKKLYFPAVLAIMMLMLSSCSVVEGIFKAGVWVGVIAVIVVIGLIIWLISKIF